MVDPRMPQATAVHTKIAMIATIRFNMVVCASRSYLLSPPPTQPNVSRLALSSTFHCKVQARARIPFAPSARVSVVPSRHSPVTLFCYPDCYERPPKRVPLSSTIPRSPMQSLRLNPILNTDSYKLTHWWQYPPDTRHIYSYVESRGGMFDETMLAMLQYIIKSNFAGQVFTLDDVEEARRIAHA